MKRRREGSDGALAGSGADAAGCTRLCAAAARATHLRHYSVTAVAGREPRVVPAGANQPEHADAVDDGAEAATTVLRTMARRALVERWSELDGDRGLRADIAAIGFGA
jgi:hypothetical protein